MTPEQLAAVKRRLMEWARSDESIRFNPENQRLVKKMLMEDSTALVLEVERAFRAYNTLHRIMGLQSVLRDPILTAEIATVVKEEMGGE